MKYLSYHQKIIAQEKELDADFISLKPDKNSIQEIGTLNLKTKSIKFVSDADWIYANGKAIISTGNDRDTASSVFATTMKICYDDQFISDIGE